MIDFELARVTAVRHVRGHVLWLRFNDGIEGELDLTDGLHGDMLEPLRDAALFARARVEGGTVAWPNGADWDPETLHARLREVKGLDTRGNDGGDWPGVVDIGRMPEISRFFGIIIRMYFVDHTRPHFHAEHGEHAITIEIASEGIHGRFPPARLGLVYEWRDAHREELLANWERLRSGKAPEPIAPLE